MTSGPQEAEDITTTVNLSMSYRDALMDDWVHELSFRINQKDPENFPTLKKYQWTNEVIKAGLEVFRQRRQAASTNLLP